MSLTKTLVIWYKCALVNWHRPSMRTMILLKTIVFKVRSGEKKGYVVAVHSQNSWHFQGTYLINIGPCLLTRSLTLGTLS